MKLTDRIAALRAISPFSRLRLEELVPLAHAMSVQVFQPGELVWAANTPLRRLTIVVSGEVIAGDTRPVGPVMGICSLLFNRPVDAPLRASSTHGAICLYLRKGHFFTLISECPELLLSYLMPCSDDDDISQTQ